MGGCLGEITSYEIWGGDRKEIWSCKWADADDDDDQDQFDSEDIMMLWNAGEIPHVTF